MTMFSMIRYMFSGSAGVDLVYALTFGACLTHSCAQILGVGQTTKQQFDADFTMHWEYQLVNVFYPENATTILLSLQRWKNMSALQRQRGGFAAIGGNDSSLCSLSKVKSCKSVRRSGAMNRLLRPPANCVKNS